MIKSYAVVSKATGNVVGRFVVHPGHALPKNVNKQNLGFMKDEVVHSSEEVFLSSTKGNMDKLEALCIEQADQCCVIDGVGHGYDLLYVQ